MKKITVLISLLAILAGYLWAQPLLAQAPIPRPTPDREAMDAGGPWGHRPQTEPSSYALTLPLAPASAIASWSKIAYQEYIGSWDVFSMGGDGSQPTRLTSSGGADITPRLNRGATRLVYTSIEPGNYEIYVMNINGSGRTRLTNNSANDYNPAWSPDGMKIVFNSYRDGQSEVYVMNADGSGQTRLTFSPDYDGEPVWSPDGSKIAFVSIRDMGQQIYTMKPDGTNVTRITATNASEFPCWSPDSLQLAFSADPDGDSWLELMVINADGTNVHSLADTGTTADLWARSWSPDGRFIANTLIGFINYQGNWYWTNAYLTGFDLTTNQLVQLGTSDVAWHPDWQSTDLLPPTSSMTALPATSPSPVVVRWSGSDAGPSGMQGYDVQVKDGAGAWTQWLTRAASTSAGYPGIGGHTYSFRVRAVDNSSNAQAWPANAQASTTVETLPPTSAINPLPTYWRGDLSVSWSGSDPGGSGIATYDVQYQDGIGGAWLDWHMGTATTAATFGGTPGYTYGLRVRAVDRAQNAGVWSDVGGVPATTFYQWRIDGEVQDIRGKSVVDASVALSPAALNTLTASVSGYRGYLAASGVYLGQAYQSGFGVVPPMSVAIDGDVIVNHWLPPLDNVVQDGNFETGVITNAWQITGAPQPYLVNSVRHSGNASIGFGQPYHAAATQVVASATGMASTIDAQGTIHLVVLTSIYTPQYLYLSKPLTAMNFTSPTLMNVAIANMVPYQLNPVSDGSGGIFLLTMRYENGQNYIAACHKLKAATDCTDARDIVALGTEGISTRLAAVRDQQGGLHLAWSSSSVYYAYLPPGGTTAVPVKVPSTTVNDPFLGTPSLAVDQNRRVHIVSVHQDYNPGWYSDISYTSMTPGGTWGTPTKIGTIPTTSSADLDVANDGTLHLLVTGQALGAFYSRKPANSAWQALAMIPGSDNSFTGVMKVDQLGKPHVLVLAGPVLHYMMRGGDGEWRNSFNLSVVEFSNIRAQIDPTTCCIFSGGLHKRKCPCPILTRIPLLPKWSLEYLRLCSSPTLYLDRLFLFSINSWTKLKHPMP